MHITQKKILEMANTHNLASLKLRELGELVGEPHPQKVKHHLSHLLKKGLLKKNPDGTIISPVTSNSVNDLFISLPIVGAANCGQALTFAQECLDGYLYISKSWLSNCNYSNLFVVKAVGNSMNKAQIKGKSIDDGDYVIINRSQKTPLEYKSKYVLSIINDMANIKRFVPDFDQNQIFLISESTQNYPPICIHENDFADYLINGEVVDVIKKPSI